MSYNDKSIGKMTFAVSAKAYKGHLPEGVMPLLEACMRGEALTMQIAGQPAFRAVPVSIDSEHGHETVSHTAVFKVEPITGREPRWVPIVDEKEDDVI